jgi:hypothetical protein
MEKFITGTDLESVIYDIIWKAEQNLMIVSPYFKLDDYFKTLFDKHVNNPKLHMLIVFGKNENDKSRSLSKVDFDYFKKFLNISVVYVPNLHAKYYANEKAGVITSINFYDASFKTNIEFGVYYEQSLLNGFKPTADHDAWNTCRRISEENETVFIKRAVYEKKLFSSLLGKSYVKSDVLYDITDKFYRGISQYKQDKTIKKINDFPDELELGPQLSDRPIRVRPEKDAVGFCIRTGKEIPYNPNRPLCDEAYRSWAYFNNPDFPEKYCHRSGKQSNGRTSMRHPIL